MTGYVDVVKALRFQAGSTWGSAGDLMNAAADEIERLRAENANLQWQLDFLRTFIQQKKEHPVD